MTAGLEIGPMSPADLDLALDWAAAEGWNPGIEDAEAFRAADPGGFLMGRVGAEPVSAISVVRHSEAFGFLGFYLCPPAHRGQGHGFATWQAGMARLGGRTVGLDGVVAQQANYARSGFVFAHGTERREGRVTGADRPGFAAATHEDLGAILAFDAAVSGAGRQAYMAAWVAARPTRLTLVRRGAGGIEALGTIRACRAGHKIGPLFAPDRAAAEALVETLVHRAGASTVAIDVPDANAAAGTLAAGLGLAPSFGCARMYRGTPPRRRLDMIFGETTFELG